mmetsp:Transcript_23428/g.44101  ORF Transcript_23428/g.44101 Transcript_23428/m.44101 type:complete len:92 (-) Transcript_23428:234-509(-)
MARARQLSILLLFLGCAVDFVTWRRPPCSTRASLLQRSGWDASWTWGEGPALEAAKALEGKLSSQAARTEWMQGLKSGSVEWAEVKLALAM